MEDKKQASQDESNAPTIEPPSIERVQVETVSTDPAQGQSPRKGKNKRKQDKAGGGTQALQESGIPTSLRDIQVEFDESHDRTAEVVKDKGKYKDKDKDKGNDKGKEKEKRSETQTSRSDAMLDTPSPSEGRRKSKGQMKRLGSALRSSMLFSFSTPRTPTKTETETETETSPDPSPAPLPIDPGVLQIGRVDPKSWCTTRHIELAITRAFPPSFAHLFLKSVRVRTDDMLASPPKKKGMPKGKFVRRTLKAGYLTHVLQTLWILSSGEGTQGEAFAQFSLGMRKCVIRHIECIWLLTLWGMDERCIDKHRAMRLGRISWMGKRYARELQGSRLWKQDAIVLPFQIVQTIRAVKDPVAMEQAGDRLIDLLGPDFSMMVRLYAHEWAISVCNLWRRPAARIDAKCVLDALPACCIADGKLATRVIETLAATQHMLDFAAFNGRVRDIMTGMARVALAEANAFMQSKARKGVDDPGLRTKLQEAYLRLILRFFIVDCLGPELREAAGDEAMPMRTIDSLWNLLLSALDLLPKAEQAAFDATWGGFCSLDAWKQLRADWSRIGARMCEGFAKPNDASDIRWDQHNY